MVVTLAVLTLTVAGSFWWMKAVDNGVIPSGDGGAVGVKGHTKKDGTQVRPHTRKKPR